MLFDMFVEIGHDNYRGDVSALILLQILVTDCRILWWKVILEDDFCV